MFPRADENLERFDQDAFDLESVADTLTGMIRDQKEPLVISLNSEWGTGKTTFLKMWQTKLREKEGCSCIYFNAWENDYAEDPLVTFIGELDWEVEGHEKTKDGKLSKIWDEFKTCGINVLKNIVPVSIGIASQGTVSPELIKGLRKPGGKKGKPAEQEAGNAITSYKKTKELHTEFKRLIGKLALEIRSQSKEFPLIILVDELDRCRPDFALSFLERIKHFMEVRNIVFVLAMDKGALEAAVECRYGATNRRNEEEGKEEKNGKDFSKGYLDRFFHLSLSLPPADNNLYVDNLFSRLGMNKV
jgi:predicted KAP-like P-loop ATPase